LVIQVNRLTKGKKDVSLMGCNTTDPPSRAPPLSYVAYASVTDDDRRLQDAGDRY